MSKKMLLMTKKVVSKIVHRVRNKGLLDTISLTCHITSGLIDYYLNPFAKRQSNLPAPDYERISSDFESAGITVIPYRIDLEDFSVWLENANFPTSYKNSYGEIFIEKALEHYVGAKLLDLKKEDIFIDVAAASSPWFEISEKMYGCTSYALDLAFPPGINGKKIGADATSMPLPNGFVTKMALHCAYEMFEGDSDIRLLPEAYRVLSGGARW